MFNFFEYQKDMHSFLGIYTFFEEKTSTILLLIKVKIL